MGVGDWGSGADSIPGPRSPDPAEIGRDIAQAVARAALAVKTNPPPPRQKWAPVPVTEIAPTSGPTPWLWDGFLARGSVTLLSALPKCGKTTLVTHLLQKLPTGGSFCGRPLAAGSAVVVSEESAEVWHERAQRLGLTDAVRLVVRPFLGRPDEADWLEFVRSLLTGLEGHPADLVVLDTLADLWPVKDENSATEVQAAMKPLRALADGRAVLAIHHLRKSDGAEGTGSRGSGALAGFVDVIAELRRPKASRGGGENRRVLSAVGRAPGIPSEWVIEQTETGYEAVAADAAELANERRQQETEEKTVEIREAIRTILVASGEEMSTAEIWDLLPIRLRVNEKRYKSILIAENGRLWVRTGNGGRDGHRFRATVPEEWVRAREERLGN